MRIKLRPSLSRRRLLRAGAAATLIAPLGAFRSLSGAFAPSAELWDRWLAHDEGNDIEPSMAAWDDLLGRYVRASAQGPTLFDYGAVTAADRDTIKRFVAELSAAPMSALARRAQLPCWVNLYNALTVDVVLDSYPVASIRDIDISPGLFANGPWDKQLAEVESEAVTLNDIEHRILRPIWRDPRVHYVLNCASIGCPNLAPNAFFGETMDAAMDRAAQAFINDPRGVMVRDGRISVSSIYDWFIEDFGGDEAGVLAHLRRYAAPDLGVQLDAIGTLHTTHYDWRLNDTKLTD